MIRATLESCAEISVIDANWNPRDRRMLSCPRYPCTLNGICMKKLSPVFRRWRVPVIRFHEFCGASSRTWDAGTSVLRNVEAANAQTATPAASAGSLGRKGVSRSPAMKKPPQRAARLCRHVVLARSPIQGFKNHGALGVSVGFANLLAYRYVCS